MGGSVSQIFRSGSALLSHRDGHKVSKETQEKITTLFEILRANPKISIQPLESLLLEIPKVCNLCSHRQFFLLDGKVITDFFYYRMKIF